MGDVADQTADMRTGDRTGQCLCGAVRLRATLAGRTVQLCHCRQCRRWTGGGPLASVRVSDLDVTGRDGVARYRASAWGERVFCPTCGSTLWWQMQGRAVAFVAVGLFDDQTGLEVGQEIFVDHRPGWLPAHAGAEQRSEAQELAALHAFLAEEGAP